jgi:hypothetical protein
MKRFLTFTTTMMLLIVCARAGDPIWGGGGYAASLSRVQAKGNPAEQRLALSELQWLKDNQAHLDELIAFLRSRSFMTPY